MPGTRRGARVSPPPIYLHFLDRELGDAFAFALRLPVAQHALATLALGTMSPLVCSMSALLENEGLRGGEGMAADLATADVLLPRSTHGTFAEFLDSRRSLYEHDQDRYPRYFQPGQLDSLAALQPRFSPGSTTEELHKRLDGWTQFQPFVPWRSQGLPSEIRNQMLGSVASELQRREGRAVTYAMFAGVGGAQPGADVVEREIRQRISLEYTAHQRGSTDALATGVGLSLEPLERALQPDWPFERDVPILAALLRAAGLGQFLEGWVRPIWQPLLAVRGEDEHFDVVSRIQWIARALEDWLPEGADRASRRNRAITAIRMAAGRPMSATGSQAGLLLAGAAAMLDGVARGLRDQGAGSVLEAQRDALESLRADVLLIVATEVEEQATLAVFSPGKSPRRHPRDHQVYLEFERIRGQRIFLVRSGMGAGGVEGSQFTTEDAIRDLTPEWTLMVGIAFGVDSDEQKIGDVLVPDRIVLYDHQRRGTTEDGEETVEYRDPPGFPDSALRGRLREGARDFAAARVQFGPLLSGADLVDNLAHRDELVRGAADGKAIGGEMELTGVFSAAERQRHRWGAAKAICDFADGTKGVNKPSRQALAAKNAALFVRHVLDQGLLVEPPS